MAIAVLNTSAGLSGKTLATLEGTQAFTGAVTVGTTLGVTGATTLSSTLAVTGDVTVNTNKFTVTAASGNTVVAGTLGVTGAATLSSTLTVNGFGTHTFSAGGTGANSVKVSQTTAANGNTARFELVAGTNDAAGLYAYTQSETGGTYNVAQGIALYNASSGGISITAAHASGAIRFYSGGTTERMRLDTSGRLGIGALGETVRNDYALDVKTSAPTWAQSLINNHASTPYGLTVDFTGATPNNATEMFARFSDATATRFRFYANGGLANYSANDVNLSDLNAKEIKGKAASSRSQLAAITFYRGKYKDSTRGHDDLMWGAQDIAAINPEWVDVWQEEERDEAGNIVKPKLLGTRDHVIFMAAVQAVAEHEQEIAAIKARLGI